MGQSFIYLLRQKTALAQTCEGEEIIKMLNKEEKGIHTHKKKSIVYLFNTFFFTSDFTNNSKVRTVS